MPLRDHFRPPVAKRASWEGFHGLWPGLIVQQLAPRLPAGFMAEPRVHLGSFYEIDVSTFEQPAEAPHAGGESGAQIAGTSLAPAPTLTLTAEFPEQYAYEVLVYDIEHERRLVAAVEIVSPANKDRPESRQLFVSKCVNLLRSGVSLSIVDLVTARQFNLYTQLLELLDCSDPAFAAHAPTYAVTCRKRGDALQAKLDTWAFPLAIGQLLPSLPLWLSEAQCVSLDLETSYEETCKVLRIS